MILVTAVKNTEHITPLQDAMLYRGIVGAETVAFNRFEKFEPQIISNNEVRIRSGAGMIQGRFFCIEPNTYDSVIISNGTQGMKRIDVIAVHFSANLTTGTQNAEWEVIKGTPHATTPTVPAVTEGNIDAGDTDAYAAWIEVELNGVNIVEVRKVFESALDCSMTRAERQELMDLLGGAATARVIDYIYPIGAIIESANVDFDPNTLYSHQTWERIKGKFLVGVDENDDDFAVVGEVAIGEKMHTLTVEEMPEHIHELRQTYSSGSLSGNAAQISSGKYDWRDSYMGAIGSNQPHNNIPPSYAIYIWKRVS